jgi:hypothetical protein
MFYYIEVNLLAYYIQLRGMNLLVNLHKLTGKIWRNGTYCILATRSCKFYLCCKRRKNKTFNSESDCSGENKYSDAYVQ